MAAVEEAFADKTPSDRATIRHLGRTFLLVLIITLVAFSSGLALRGAFSAESNDLPLPEIERTKLLPGEHCHSRMSHFMKNTKRFY